MHAGTGRGMPLAVAAVGGALGRAEAQNARWEG